MKPMNLTCTDTSSVAGLRAFSRTEVLVLTGVLGLLLCVVIPALAHDRTRASRVTCANNLRQIGMGFQLWGNDHGDRAVYEVEIADGGTRRHPLAVNTWFHFARLSNELVSPKILLCPSDTGSMATEFTGDPSRGYLHPNFANRATSYGMTYRFGALGSRVQVADRNVRFNIGAAGCSVFNSAWGIGLPYLGANDGWTSGLHELAGNFLSFDGSVVQSDSVGLRAAFNAIERLDGAVSLHFSIPR